jgi:hypothetical protein
MNDDPPQEPEGPAKTGLYCFMDAARECGPDCMAFLPEPADTAVPVLGPQQKSCILIVSAERLGRYASGIVSVLRRSQERTENEAADKKRADSLRGVPKP